MGNESSRGLHRFAVVTAWATLCLIIAGALVTSNDAGLSVPDWPLSFGTLMPEMVGGVFYEHGHRMIATGVGLLTILLNIWLWRAEPRPWVRRLGMVALGSVIAQGVLGGITVLYFLPTPISVMHATLAQFFFCMVVTLAIVTSRGWEDFGQPLRIALWKDGGVQLRLAGLMAVAVFVQLILGAAVRHSGTMQGTKAAVLVTSVLLAHLAGALVVASIVLLASRSFITRTTDPWTVRLGYVLLVLLLFQLLLGLGSYRQRRDAANQVQPTPEKVVITVAHVAVGALLLATSLLVGLKTARLATQRTSDTVADPRLAGQAL